jgi:hypothetical protein
MMTFPVIPPDPTPEEVARTRAALKAAGALGDWMVENLPLDAAAHRQVNAAMRGFQQGIGHVEDIEEKQGVQADPPSNVDLLDELFGDT